MQGTRLWWELIGCVGCWLQVGDFYKFRLIFFLFDFIWTSFELKDIVHPHHTVGRFYILRTGVRLTHIP